MTKPLIFILIFLVTFSCKEEKNEDFQELNLLEAYSGQLILNIDADSPSEDVPLDRNITLIFSSKISAESIQEGISLLANNQEVTYSNTLSSSGNSVNLTVPGGLKGSTTYTILINEKLTSETGTNANPLSFSFLTTLTELRLESIHIDQEDVTTKNLIQNIKVNPTIVLNFSDAVDLKQFQRAIDSNIGSLEFNSSNENKTITINSSNKLQFLKKYNLTIPKDIEDGKNYNFKEYSLSFYTQLDSTYKFPEISDEALLTKVQEQTFKYFWDFAHPNSGLARERNTSGDLVTIGGSGFGVMAILVGVHRNFITRQQAVERLNKIVTFLESADRFHGVWPHWMNGNTGATIAFSTTDNGADLVETAFMIQGLLTARQFLDESVPDELAIINKITALWEAVEWNWFQKEGENVLTWHWSPNFGFQMNLKIRGWNEALIIYTLAASSPTYPISKEVYEQGWAQNGGIQNGSQSYGITMPLGSNRGGPLFFAHYSFLGMDPTNLEDQYANYWEQNKAHTQINRAYCIANPLNYVGYSEAVWGLTASDNHEGYSAHSPNNDLGVITPTAAISSIPYTPEASTEAIRHFYYLMGDKLWGEYGFYDAFNITKDWYANSYLAIDQGPIIIMIENYRTGYIWDLYMADPEVQEGLTKLGFTY